MSNSIKGLVVTFKDSVSEEYAESVKSVILMINHVASVDESVDDVDDIMCRGRIGYEYREKFLNFLKTEFKF